ncbi:esterase-like activity of phytase family protein [Sphingomonas rubra]|nr:esterase-like activity of phytase family protein [Sphingomonas rubra]
MHRPLVLLAAILLPLAVVPGWSGEERSARLRASGAMTARRVPIDPHDAGRRRVGSLTYLGGVVLDGDHRAFGGFSALHVDGNRFTLLSDGGNLVRFRMGGDWRPRRVVFSFVPAGPRTGWEKRDRDAESLARDPVTARWWVGFENVNQIWRYAPDWTRAEAVAAPAAMRRWRRDGGPESLARLADGRFVAIAESPRRGERMRDGIVWPGDPTTRRPAFRFAYVASPGFSPSDMTALPNGGLLVLERALSLPFRWSARLVLVDPAALRPAAVVSGRTIAQLAPPLLADNYEGLAAVREGRDTILWLLSDDNQLFLERTLLLKFRLET